MNNKIKCPFCSKSFEPTDVYKHEMEEKLLQELQVKHQAEVDALKLQQQRVEESKQNEIGKIKKLAVEKAKLEALENVAKDLLDKENQISELKKRAEQAEQLELDIRKEKRELEDSKQKFELEKQRQLDEEREKIRDKVFKEAQEKQEFKDKEKEMVIENLRKSLADAQRKAQQGSQQMQGEVLELDLENRLKEEFPLDEIIEVKKGQKGADIKQVVCSQSLTKCGTILWETKNGKWQPAWISKFKQDVREANANIGVIVSHEIPNEIGEFKQLDGNVWVVKPKLATRLAVALRTTILQVDIANKMNANKDAKMESLYQFLVGPEFKHRVEAIIESYTNLQDEIEKEKRSYALKWARQEKSIRGIVDNTIGMYGDLQGIIGKSLPKIETLELDSGDIEEV